MFTKKEKYFLLGLLFCSLLVWFGYTLNGFVFFWDDEQQIFNSDVKSLSLQSIKAVFTSYYAGMYQPITSLIYTLINTFFYHNPFVFHLVALLLHLGCIVLVYKLVRRFEIGWVWHCVITALFAVHPIQQEVLAWASAMSTAVFSMFYILSLTAYISYTSSGQRRYYIWAFVFFLFGCLSKVNAITLPVLLIGIDFVFYKRWYSWPSLLNKIPFFAVAVIFGLVVILERGEFMPQNRLGLDYNYMSVLGYQLVFLIKEYLWFFNIVSVYEYPRSFPWIGVVLSYLMFAAALVYAVVSKNRLFVFGVLIFVSNMLLVSNVLSFNMNFTYSRYAYIACIGFLLSLASLFRLSKKSLYVAVPLLVLMAVIAAVDSTYWKNEETMAKKTLKITPENSSALYTLAFFNARRGDMEAAYYYADKIAKDYDYYMAKSSDIKATYYMKHGQYAKALAILEKTPEYTRSNIRNIFFSQGTCYIKLKYYDVIPEYVEHYLSVAEQGQVLKFDDYDLAFQFLRDSNHFDKALQMLDRAIGFIKRTNTPDDNAVLHKAYYFKAAIFNKLGVVDSIIPAIKLAKEAALRYSGDLKIVNEYEQIINTYQPKN